MIPLREFHDTEELSSSLKHADVRAIQVSRGSFQARLGQLCLEDWSIQFIAFDEGATACAGRGPKDRFAFIVPLTSARGARLLGKDIAADSLGVYAPGSEHADYATAGYAEAVLVLTLDALSALGENGNPPNFPSAGSYHYNTMPHRCDGLRRILTEAIRTDADQLASAEIVRSLKDALSLQLVEAVLPTDAGRLGRPSLPRPAILRKIADLIQHQSDRVIYASELAAAADVSLPTLQRAFIELFGIPPARYLMLKRLYLARSRLRSGGYASVGSAAASCGFWELSRFSKRYRVQFGELPSETLRSARKRR